MFKMSYMIKLKYISNQVVRQQLLNLSYKRYSSCKNLGKNNYHPECEKLINKQINLELYAAYFYSNLQYFFDRNDVGLPGFSKLFKHNVKEELGHANLLMEYQRKRGGDLSLNDIKAPPNKEWDHCESIAKSLELEKQVTQSLEKIAFVADANKDYHTNDFIVTSFLPSQYEDLNFLASLLARIEIAGDNAGIILIDQELGKREYS